MKEKYPNLPEAQVWEKIAIIDTESGSGELYANTEKGEVKIGEYLAITLEAPYTPEKYIEAIELCYKEGVEVCIIDSTTHLWAGVGGLLEQQGNIAKRQGYNSYTAWRDVTPLHNRFVDTMLQTDVHIIATMRAKQEYVQEKDSNGNTKIRKVGLNPIQRDGMEYEFTTFLEIDADHTAFGSKDRTGLVDQKYFKITPETGREFMKWLESGVDNSTPSKVVAESKNETDDLQSIIAEIDKVARSKATTKEGKEKVFAIIKAHHKTANYKTISDINMAQTILSELNNLEG
jgi:nucleoside-triphosphatase THEP1